MGQETLGLDTAEASLGRSFITMSNGPTPRGFHRRRGSWAKPPPAQRLAGRANPSPVQPLLSGDPARAVQPIKRARCRTNSTRRAPPPARAPARPGAPERRAGRGCARRRVASGHRQAGPRRGRRRPRRRVAADAARRNSGPPSSGDGMGRYGGLSLRHLVGPLRPQGGLAPAPIKRRPASHGTGLSPSCEET